MANSCFHSVSPVLKIINECRHSETQRCFTGMWITPEIHKAVKLGYKIVDISKCSTMKNNHSISQKRDLWAYF